MLSYSMYLILITIISTSCMTLFSYLLSNKANKQFREPEMLNSLIKGSETFSNSVDKSHASGWLIHYVIGFLFVVAFVFLYHIDCMALNFLSFFIFGICAGIIGVIGWQVMFMLNNDPPKVHLKFFYLQLIGAHLVFTLFLMISYYVLTANNLI